MIFPTFIEFFSTLKQAQDCRFGVNSVHLMPLSDERYTFSVPQSFGDLQSIYIVHNGVETLHTSVFEYISILNTNILTITNVNFDNWDQVRLKLVNNENETLYSSLIRVCSQDLDKTTLIQFRSNKWNFIGAVRLNLFKVQNKRQHENSTYYQVSKERTISTGSKRNYLEKYYLDAVQIDTANSFIDVLTLPIIYFGGIRTYVNELPELEDLQGGENYVSTYFFVNKNIDDVIDTNSSVNLTALGHIESDELLGNEEDNVILGDNYGN